MYMLISPISNFYKKLEELFSNQQGQDGILYDVETILTDNYNDEYIELPLIWIEKQPITPGSPGQLDKQDMYLEVPISIVCCSDEHNEYPLGETESLSIASRCITSLLNGVPELATNLDNFMLCDIRLDGIDCTDTFEIPSKRVIIPGTKLQLTFTLSINWMVYEEITSTAQSVVNFNNETLFTDYNITNIELP